ncbi:MAG: polysaccharide biosynthesis protein [Fluviicola sp.]|nr:MAG: polysaccharide biosynthesis protein [Fluviicola sp.]
MKLIRSKLFFNIGIYGLTNAINAGIPFFLLPILTHYLLPKDFAIIALFQALTSFLMPFISLNFTSAVSVNYFHRETINFGEYIYNGLVLLFISGLTFTLFILFFSSSISALVNFPEPWLIWVVIYVFLFKIIDLISVIWRVQSKALPFGIMKISLTIVELTLAILLIVSIGMNWEGRLISMITSVLVFALISSFLLWKKNLVIPKLKKDYIKDILKFGIPLIPHTIGATLIVFSDRIFIVKMVGEDALGLYSVGYQIGMVISLIQNSFNQAWTPYFYGKLKENKEKVKLNIVKFTYGYFVFMMLLVLLVYLTEDLIFKWFIGENFHDAKEFVVWIALAFAINGMYKMVVNYFFFLKKTIPVSIITFLAAILNLILNYFLILEYGAIGAAKAAVLAFLVQFIVMWVISARYYPMPWLFFTNKNR